MFRRYGGVAFKDREAVFQCSRASLHWRPAKPRKNDSHDAGSTDIMPLLSTSCSHFDEPCAAPQTNWRVASKVYPRPLQTELLTMYKPNFCAECGEQVLRARWRIWNSRRFCPDCAPRFYKTTITRYLITSGLLILLGFLAGRTAKPSAPALLISPGQSSASSSFNGNRLNDSNRQSLSNNGSAAERPTEPDEVVSICGARTKKGTPCSRRVRGTGRCWQHKGMAAMLPDEKLKVAGN